MLNALFANAQGLDKVRILIMGIRLSRFGKKAVCVITRYKPADGPLILPTLILLPFPEIPSAHFVPDRKSFQVKPEEIDLPEFHFNILFHEGQLPHDLTFYQELVFFHPQMEPQLNPQQKSTPSFEGKERVS